MINPEDKKFYPSDKSEQEYTTERAMANSFILVDMGEGEDKLTPVRYDQFVARLFKPDTRNEMLHHAKGGCCEEAGEVSDVIKREITYKRDKTKEGKSIREGVIEELGDLRFYMQAIQNIYGITEQEILQYNGYKLSERYAGLVYSDKSAGNRADKATNGGATND